MADDMEKNRGQFGHQGGQPGQRGNQPGQPGQGGRQSGQPGQQPGQKKGGQGAEREEDPNRQRHAS